MLKSDFIPQNKLEAEKKPPSIKCPWCDEGEPVPWIRRNKDTGLLICPKCWRIADLQGNAVENPYARAEGAQEKRTKLEQMRGILISPVPYGYVLGHSIVTPSNRSKKGVGEHKAPFNNSSLAEVH